MNTKYFFAMMAIAGGLTACNADMDIVREAQILSAPDITTIKGELIGDDYVLTWPESKNEMQITRLVNGTKNGSDIYLGTSCVFKDMDTNVENTFIFKYTDFTNFSDGVFFRYTRPGAAKCNGISMTQVELDGGKYDAKVEWEPNGNATTIKLEANNGADRQIKEDLPGNSTYYVIPDVKEGENWSVTIRGYKSEGLSLPSSTSLRIGKVAVAFLSEWETPEEHIANADDDEAYAWMWFHENYPKGEFIPFSSITSADQLEPYRVIFWIRDLETGNEGDAFRYSENITNATPSIIEWYKNGGSILLWSHAIPYIEKLGRIPANSIMGNDHNVNTGKGGFNGDVWRMAVQLAPAGGKFFKDHSTHPIYKGLDVVTEGNQKLIAFKGAGWTEDHNCLFFNFPAALTGKGNQEEECYTLLTKEYGIYPLGTWDSQIEWVSQLNVWEAQQGNTEFKGTVLCIGNGGCEFFMKDPDGHVDYEKGSANAYQKNVETLAKNCIEYLKTR